MSRHPGRFSESERTLMEKGFWRTGDVVVLRSVTLGATESATELVTELDTARSNGPSISSSEGEIVFTSWDDGDPSTWEGSIFMASYAPAADLLTNVQLDISDGTTDTVWEEVVYVNPPTPEPEYQMMRQHASDASPGANRATVATSESDTANEDPPPTPTPTPSPTPGPAPKSPARVWVECTVGSCSAAAFGCAFLGPAWGECFGIACSSAAVGCAVQGALNAIP